MRKLLLLCACAFLVCCGGPGPIEYDQGRCLINGQAATQSDVEEQQAAVTRRLLSRQPIFGLITVLMVLLAGASHIDKLILLLSTRRTEARGLGQRLRLALEREKAHPVRYFAIVVSTLSCLAMAGGCYIYLDVDKRASERALGLLQFCHLALRSAAEQNTLVEQRQNLQTIETTAGDIRTLLDKLPPEEQRKAQGIVTQMNTALAKQGKLVGQYFQHADESARAIHEETQAVQRGLSSVQASVLNLKTIPESLSGLSDQLRQLDRRVGGTEDRLDRHLGAVDDKLGAAAGKMAACQEQIAAVEATLKALAARPACVCEGGRRNDRTDGADGGSR